MPDRGSAMVEFALTIPLALILVLGVVEVAVVARSEIQLVHAVREGARQAATSPDTAKAAAAVRTALGSGGARARVSVSRPSRIGLPATVTASVPHTIAGPLFGGFTVDLSARATMRTER